MADLWFYSIAIGLFVAALGVGAMLTRRPPEVPTYLKVWAVKIDEATRGHQR